MNQREEMRVTPLLPIEIPKGRILFSRGIRAGRWIFATGHHATDYRKGISADVRSLRLPHFGKPKNEKEAQWIFDDLKEVLSAAGTNFHNVVRLDQYYTTWKAVDPYHVVRRAVFGKYIAPSTSIIQEGLLLAGAEMDVQMIAIIPDGDFSVQPLQPIDVDSTPTSGYAPVVKAGDYIFIAGQMASWGKGNEGGIAPEARVPAGHLWRGTQIKLETEYIITRRLAPALKAAGGSLDSMIKAQIYMSRVEDFPAFNEVWKKYFPKNPPVTTLIPCSTPGFGAVDASIEINALALAVDGKTRRREIDAEIFTGYDNQAGAILAGDLLLVSGLMAVDKKGMIADAEVDPDQPYFGSSIQAQMEYMLQNVMKICQAANTSLKNVVRIQQFHTDLMDFYPAYQIWQKYLPGYYLPISAVQVPEPMPVPGCTVMLDLWFYAPPENTCS
jgi:enamine deaminase RidA (YjgF/YER057c/UK114 family)